LKKAFNISFNKPVILVVQHSVTTQSKEVAIQIKKTLMAIRALKKETIIVYPNSDTGGKEMIDIINKHKNLKYLRIVKTIQNDLFMGLLDNISVLVGNSSAGIVEAPFFNLPVVNIGLRQKGRERSGNVIDVNHNSKDIIRAIRKALTKKFRENIKRGKNIYFSKKNVEKKVVDVLLHTKLNEKLLTKEMTY
jgi:UDP-hydrolysing UDP-N-acetyl-D-glucosamine 2-epimerase